MRSTVWANIRQYPRRLIAVLVALTIGIGFAFAATVFTDTTERHLTATAALPYSRMDLYITVDEHMSAQALAQRLFETKSFSAEPMAQTRIRLDGDSVKLSSLPYDRAMRYFKLTDGNWPTNTREVLVDAATAKRHSLSTGSTIRLSSAVTVTVTGITDLPVDAWSKGTSRVFGYLGLIHDLSGGSQAHGVAVRLPAGMTTGDARAAITAECPSCTVSTPTELGQAAVGQLLAGMAALRTMLLVFAALALVVTALVVANTFTILFAQRQRDIALLRCIGATGSQVRLQLLAEAAAVGAVGSALGACAGTLTGFLAAKVTGSTSGGIGLSLPLLCLMFAIGIVLATVAGIWPARRAARVRPLQALRPAMGAAEDGHGSTFRFVIGLVLFFGGSAVMVLVANQSLQPGPGVLLVAVAAGAGSAIGALMLTRSVIPVLLRLLAPLGRLAGVPGRLAAANAIRNPSRSAATAAALLVGVTLIVMMQTAMASTKATIAEALNTRYPVDLTVIAAEGSALPDELVAKLRAVDLAPQPVRGTSGELDGKQVTVLAPTPQALALTRTGQQLSDQVILLPTWWPDHNNQVTLRIGEHSATLQVQLSNLAGIHGDAVVISPAALKKLTSSSAVTALWAALPPGADIHQASADINRVLGHLDNVTFGGVIIERAAVQSTLQTLLTLITGLLAVALVIAIVGVGNTIGLSVIERRRESALLRALGLKRYGLTLSVQFEALLLSVVGVLIGLGLGILYGWGGTRAALGTLGDTLVFAVPWTMVALTAGATVLAGLIAATLPAYRAAKVPPAAALADAG